MMLRTQSAQWVSKKRPSLEAEVEEEPFYDGTAKVVVQRLSLDECTADYSAQKDT